MNENWFSDLLKHFVPTDAEIEGKTPATMIASAGRKAFAISTAAALPPGPLGLFTILPELLAVTRIQLNLIYRIAAYYGKAHKVNATLVLLIFANEAGLAIGRRLVTKIGSRILVRTLGEQSARPLARSIAARIGGRLAQKAAGRWIPLLLAPVFGAFSRRMTIRIGEEAVKLFSQELDLLEGPAHHDAAENGSPPIADIPRS